MATHDYVIDNQTAPNFRADLNNALLAIVSNNSGSTEPPVTYANMMWYDTANNLLRMRNEADDAFITLGTLDQVANTFAAAVALASQAEAEAGTNNTKVMTPLRVAQAITALGGSASLSTFTSSGTYTKPAGASFVYIECLGGGGGGASAFRQSGNRMAGGGAGGTFEMRILRASDVPNSVSVIVGAGAGSRTGSTQQGLSGGTSSFGSLVSALGGGGGQASQSSDTVSGTGGYCGYYGGSDFNGRASGGMAAGNGGGKANGLLGGNSVYGGAGGGEGQASAAGGVSAFAGNGGKGSHNANGVNGGVPAGGGGGATSSSGTVTSGAGGRGEVRVFSW